MCTFFPVGADTDRAFRLYGIVSTWQGSFCMSASCSDTRRWLKIWLEHRNRLHQYLPCRYYGLPQLYHHALHISPKHWWIISTLQFKRYNCYWKLIYLQVLPDAKQLQCYNKLKPLLFVLTQGDWQNHKEIFGRRPVSYGLLIAWRYK